jgi:hypothetical protein
MRRLIVLLALVGALAGLAATAASASPGGSFAAQWDQVSVKSGCSGFCEAGTATAFAYWSGAPGVRSVLFTFYCNNYGSGTCISHTDTRIAENLRTGVVGVTFLWTDQCVFPGYNFRAQFLDGKGHVLGTAWSDDPEFVNDSFGDFCQS